MAPFTRYPLEEEELSRLEIFLSVIVERVGDLTIPSSWEA